MVSVVAVQVTWGVAAVDSAKLFCLLQSSKVAPMQSFLSALSGCSGLVHHVLPGTHSHTRNVL